MGVGYVALYGALFETGGDAGLDQAELSGIRKAAERGVPATDELALAILRSGRAELADLLAAATRMRRRTVGEGISLCSILSARGGACPEDCRFCAQSARWGGAAEVFPMLGVDEMRAAYRAAGRLPIRHFGVVTSGRGLGGPEVDDVCEAIRGEGGGAAEWCASLGCLARERLEELKRAGLRRYHHNLETARSFFPEICTSHTYEDRLRTVRMAKELGLEICCGGILGLGETDEQRVELAVALRAERVDSIPLNFLVPVEGTGSAERDPLEPLEILRCVMMFRLTNPGAEIKVCAGRCHLRDLQSMIFLAGATGMMIGPLLTVAGREPEEDLQMVRDLGFPDA